MTRPVFGNTIACSAHFALSYDASTRITTSSSMFACLVVSFLGFMRLGACAEILQTDAQPFVPNCYRNDDMGLSADVTVVLGHRFVSKHGHNFVREAQDLLALTRLVFAAQLNIALNVTIVSNTSTVIRDECDVRRTQVDMYGARIPGFVLFISGCEYGVNGMSGVALVSSFCDASSVAVATEDELDVAHEMGHVFGATHTLFKGGIMDYALGKYNDQYGFHPDNRDELCLYLSRVLSSSATSSRRCRIKPRLSTCGDGVLEMNEQCECVDMSGSCFQCFGCRTNMTCSVHHFVRKPKFSKPFVAVKHRYLASRECCFRNRILIEGSCAGNGVCATGGVCIDACAEYGLERCAYRNCVQFCRVGNQCLELHHAQTGLSVTRLPDGSRCFRPRRRRGFCRDGSCATNALL